MIKGEMRKYAEPKNYSFQPGTGLTDEDESDWYGSPNYRHFRNSYDNRFGKLFTLQQRQEVEEQLDEARRLGMRHGTKVRRAHGQSDEVGRITGLHYTPTYAYNEVTSEMECIIVEWPPREGARLPYSANYKPEELIVVTEEKE